MFSKWSIRPSHIQYLACKIRNVSVGVEGVAASKHVDGIDGCCSWLIDKVNDIDQVRSRVDIWETCVKCCFVAIQVLRMSFAQPDVNHDETIFLGNADGHKVGTDLYLPQCLDVSVRIARNVQ